MSGLSQALESLRGYFGLSVETQEKVLASLLALLAIALARLLFLRLVYARVQEPAARYQWRKTSGTIAFAVTVLVVARVWLEAFASLATFLGLLTAGLAIALKDPLTNVAGWVFLVWRKPFEVGDRIEMGGVAGDVIDIRVFQFSVLEVGNWVNADQSTGRIIHIPNGKVFTELQANFSQGFKYIWNEVPVLVTFESDWRRAKQILLEIARRHGEPVTAQAAEQVARAARKYFIHYATLTPTVYTSVADSGVLLTIRHLCGPRERRAVTQTIWEDILDAFGRCPDIDFAYPTQRFFDNGREGKAGAGAGSGEAPPAGPQIRGSRRDRG